MFMYTIYNNNKKRTKLNKLNETIIWLKQLCVKNINEEVVEDEKVYLFFLFLFSFLFIYLFFENIIIYSKKRATKQKPN
jgi:hypothetical protein